MSHKRLLKAGKISQAEYLELDQLKRSAYAADQSRYRELERLYAKRPRGLMRMSPFPRMRRAFGTRKDGQAYPKNHLESVPPKVRRAVKVLEDYTRSGALDRGVSMVDFLLKRPKAAEAVLGAAKIGGHDAYDSSREFLRIERELGSNPTPDDLDGISLQVSTSKVLSRSQKEKLRQLIAIHRDRSAQE